MRVSHRQEGSWPDGAALPLTTPSPLGRIAEPVPPRPDPEQESGTWPTDSQRQAQRLEDLGNAAPWRETVASILKSGGVVGAVWLAAQLHPASKAAVALVLEVARILSVPAAALTAPPAFIKLMEGFGIAWDANGAKGDLDRARQLIERGSRDLAASTRSLAAEMKGTASAMRAGEGVAAEVAVSDVPASIVASTDRMLESLTALAKASHTMDASADHTRSIAALARSIADSVAVAATNVDSAAMLTDEDVAMQQLLANVGPLAGMSPSGERAAEMSKAGKPNTVAKPGSRVMMAVSVPGAGDVWFKTTALRRDLFQELVRRGTWPRSEIARYLKTRSLPPDILSAQMSYLQVEIRVARCGPSMRDAKVELGKIVGTNEPNYRYEPAGLRPVTIQGTQWWFDLSIEDHRLLQMLFSPQGLRTAEINHHAVKRIKTALENGRRTNDPRAPSKVVGSMQITRIGRGIAESYYRFTPEVEPAKLSQYELLGGRDYSASDYEP